MKVLQPGTGITCDKPPPAPGVFPVGFSPSPPSSHLRGERARLANSGKAHSNCVLLGTLVAVPWTLAGEDALPSLMRVPNSQKEMGCVGLTCLPGGLSAGLRCSDNLQLPTSHYLTHKHAPSSCREHAPSFLSHQLRCVSL